MRILVGRAGVVGPEHRSAKPPEPVRAARARAGTSGTAARVRSAASARSSGPYPGLERVDHRADRERPQHRRNSADMVAMRVRDDDRRERAQPQPPELTIDMRLRWTRIDEERALGRLEQDPVSLARRPGRRRGALTAATTKEAGGRPTSRSRRGEREQGPFRRVPDGGTAAARCRAATAAIATTIPITSGPERGLGVRERGDQAGRERDPGSCETGEPRKAPAPRTGSAARAPPSRAHSRGARASPAPRARSRAPSRAGSCRTEARGSARSRSRRPPRCPRPRRAPSGTG